MGHCAMGGFLLTVTDTGAPLRFYPTARTGGDRTDMCQEQASGHHSFTRIHGCSWTLQDTVSGRLSDRRNDSMGQFGLGHHQVQAPSSPGSAESDI